MSTSLPFVHVLTCSMLVMGSVTGRSAGAQEFSGDMIRSANQRTLDSSRVHVKGAMLRIETVSGGNVQYNVLLNDGDRSFTAIDVTNHRYTVLPLVSSATAQQLPPAIAMFHPGSSGNPCDYWNGVLQTLPASVGPAERLALACTSAGSDHVSGRAAQKWAVTSNREPGTTSNGVVDGAGKTLGTNAAKIAAKAARQKADSSMAKKAKHIFHIP